MGDQGRAGNAGIPETPGPEQHAQGRGVAEATRGARVPENLATAKANTTRARALRGRKSQRVLVTMPEHSLEKTKMEEKMQWIIRT
mmetsp:Transcript_21453/g.49976  ORF Transcript_21453/g.49976 Transcript_21453/m.49976 type:complete len:86 (+) Transcript_21453:199-456(+)